MNQVPQTVASESVVSEEGSREYLALLAKVKLALDSAVDISVPTSDIRPYDDQPRKHFNEDGLRRLSASIDVGGQTTLGIIRENPTTTRYELIDGERRWRAVNLIPSERRPLYSARLIKADDDVIRFMISGIANFNRENHTATEVTDTIDRFLNFNLPMREIASLLGISENWAYQMHGLKKLVPEVLTMLEPGQPKGRQLPISAAIQISKIDPRLQAGIAERVLSKDITLARLRGEVIKVAHKAGFSIQTREVSPLKKWESFGNRVEQVARSMHDAKLIIESGAIDRIVKAHPAEIARTLQSLRGARLSIESIEEAIRKIKE